MGIYGKGEAMFRDTTAYGADDGARYAVLVGDKVVAVGLVYGDALRLAQRTKGSRTSLQPAPVMSTVTVRVPARFYTDHRARDCGETDVVVSETKRHVTVTLDCEGYVDLLSDAEYYSHREWFEFESQGLCTSAIATLKALRATQVPGDWTVPV